jgi:flagellar hook assembly protein FlgD
VGVGDNPNPVPVEFLALRSENPMRAGPAAIVFGLARRERVELTVYDVAGRRVRRLAQREFPAGEHRVVWDGGDDDGQPVARGLYFYRLRTPSFASQKKLVVLRR